MNNFCSENAISQFDPTANILNIVQYIVLHPLFSTKAFLIKLFKNFEEQAEDFFNVISDSLLKISDDRWQKVLGIILKIYCVVYFRT